MATSAESQPNADDSRLEESEEHSSSAARVTIAPGKFWTFLENKPTERHKIRII